MIVGITIARLADPIHGLRRGTGRGTEMTGLTVRRLPFFVRRQHLLRRRGIPRIPDAPFVRHIRNGPTFDAVATYEKRFAGLDVIKPGPEWRTGRVVGQEAVAAPFVLRAGD